MDTKLRNIIYVTVILSLFLNFTYAKELDLIKEKSFTVASGQKLYLKTDIGDVTIKTWDKNEASIKIYGNKNAERNMEFSFNQDEKGIKIIGEKEHGSFFGWFNKIDLKYEIILPSKFNLELRTSGGDMSTKSITGNLDMKTSGGDIYVKNSRGELVGSTSGGDVVVDDFVGNSKISTSGGDIQVNSSNGKTIASTSGGDIVIKSSEGKISAETSGGDISLNYAGKNNDISLSTSGGDIDVKVPSDLNADVEIRTSGGTIYNDFGNVNNAKITKSSIIGKFNNGGKRFVCKTSGGDIRIRQN